MTQSSQRIESPFEPVRFIESFASGFNAAAFPRVSPLTNFEC
jgi:hypothetical protein